MTAANTELEFPMSDDIKQEMTTLGISRVCLNQSSGSDHKIANGLVVYFHLNILVTYRVQILFSTYETNVIQRTKTCTNQVGLF